MARERIKISSLSIRTESLDAKFAAAAARFADEPYVAIACKPGRDSPPQAYLVSPDLWEMLLRNTDLLGRLAASPGFGELRGENRRLAEALEGMKRLLDDARAQLGEDAVVSRACWVRVKVGDSVLSAVEEAERRSASLRSGGVRVVGPGGPL